MYKLPLKIICLMLGIYSGKVAAQQMVNLPLITTGFGHELFTSNIRKIVKDKNNFLWFATQDALCKFDGIAVTRFTKSNNSKTSLLGTDCIAMDYKANDSLLYILSAHEGLNIINVNTNFIEKQVTSEALIASSRSVFYNYMFRLGPHLVITANTNQYVFFNTVTGRVDDVGLIALPSGTNIQSIFSYESFIVIIRSDGVLAFFNKKFKKIKEFKFSEDKNFLITKFQTVQNKLWLSTSTGVRCINLDSKKEINILSEMPGFPIECLTSFTMNLEIVGNYIFISNAKRIFIYDLESATYVVPVCNKGEEEANFLNSASAFFYDGKELWIGGPYGVAYVQNLKPMFSPFYYNREFSPQKIGQSFCIKPITKTAVVVAAQDGFYQIDTKKNIIKTIVNGEYINSISHIKENSFLLSGTKRLYVYTNEKIWNASSLYPELKILEKDIFCSIELLKGQKVLLVSTLQNGIYLWDMQTHSIQKFDKQSVVPLHSVQLKRAWVESENRIILVSETSLQLVDFEKHTIKTVFDFQQLPNEKSESLMDICKQRGSYWVAAYGLGIIKLNASFKEEKILTSKDGLLNLAIFKIFNVGDSLIVATSNDGMVVYNTIRDKIRTYYGEDGLQSNSFNELSGYQQGDSIYIGGLKGFTIFNTKNYRTNDTPPKLYFNTISYETSTGTKDTTNLFIKSFEIPNNATQTKITFTGLNYINPNRVKYSYKITGIQENWSAFKTDNFATLTGNNPGTYTLEVKAANEDGVECAPISMTLHFLPKWYQTWLFKIAVVLAIAGLLYALYSFRIRQLKRIISVRQKISSDLHDDIGSTLSTINMYSQVAQLHGPGHVPIMHNIQENAQEVLEKLDDIVWATNPKNDQVKNLVERIDAFARPLLQAKEIQFVFNAEEHVSSHKIGEVTRQSLFLICKEAITNAAKYAECKTCTVSLYKKGKYIHCTITDDGKGFDATQPTERNGLLNMKLRATAVKGKLEIISSIGNGTSINVVMPL